MRRIKPNRKSILALGALLTVTLVGGTFAYFSQDLTAENKLLTGKYDTDIKEEFIPPDDWLPGVEIEKEVSIKNNGNVPVVAVAKFSESCVRREDVTVTEYLYSETTGKLEPVEKKLAEVLEDADQAASYKEGAVLPVRFTADDGSVQEVAIKKLGAEELRTYTDDPSDEAEKKTYAEQYDDKWVYCRVPDPLTEAETSTDTYYFLYVGIIEGGAETSPVLNSVTMNPLLDSSVKHTKTVAQVDENGENSYTTTYEVGKYGYDSASYKLTVAARTVQATKDAVAAVMTPGNGVLPDTIPTELQIVLDYVKGQCRGNQLPEQP